VLEGMGVALEAHEFGLRPRGPSLILGPACLDFPRPPNDSVRYAGCCAYTDRLQDEDRATQELLGRLDSDLPVVYCSMGTHPELFREREGFLRALMDAFAPRTDLQLVLQGDLPPALAASLPAQIHPVDWVDPLRILARADAAILHGGLSSLLEAIHCRVPVLLVPFWNDAFGNAARSVHCGIGLRRRIGQLRPETLTGAVDRLRKDPSFAERLEALRSAVGKGEDLGLAVAWLEEQMKSESI
jgi:UDP:flavonoid glycosyltransferase YjiC (YdhE family)